MSLIDRQAAEIAYDDYPDPDPPLTQDPHDLNQWSYPSPPPVLHAWATTEPQLKVKLESHGAPGSDKFYRTWEVSYSGADPNAVLAMLQRVDDALQAQYGGLP